MNDEPFTVEEVALIEAAAIEGEWTRPDITLRLIARLRINRADALAPADAAECPFDCSVCHTGEDDE
jgi:hypothetical protein